MWCYILLYVLRNCIICVLNYGAHMGRIMYYQRMQGLSFKVGQGTFPNELLDKEEHNTFCPPSTVA